MRVLVVEDEPHLAATIRRGLTEAGFAVDIATNGLDGLWAARSTPYDVVVLDIMLPGLNGYRVVSQLREADVWTPVLMLTAKDGEYDQAEAFDLGADDYLTKPFSFVVLTARIRALVRRGRPPRPAVLVAGDLRVDPARRSVARGEQDIALTPREFAVLEFLMRRVGEVVRKADIVDAVWDSAYTGDPNIVEVYIRYLRTKIDIPFGREAIETVRGVGYRLVESGG